MSDDAGNGSPSSPRTAALRLAEERRDQEADGSGQSAICCMAFTKRSRRGVTELSTCGAQKKYGRRYHDLGATDCDQLGRGGASGSSPSEWVDRVRETMVLCRHVLADV